MSTTKESKTKKGGKTTKETAKAKKTTKKQAEKKPKATAKKTTKKTKTPVTENVDFMRIVGEETPVSGVSASASTFIAEESNPVATFENTPTPDEVIANLKKDTNLTPEELDRVREILLSHDKPVAVVEDAPNTEDFEKAIDEFRTEPELTPEEKDEIKEKILSEINPADTKLITEEEDVKEEPATEEPEALEGEEAPAETEVPTEETSVSETPVAEEEGLADNAVPEEEKADVPEDELNTIEIESMDAAVNLDAQKLSKTEEVIDQPEYNDHPTDFKPVEPQKKNKVNKFLHWLTGGSWNGFGY